MTENQGQLVTRNAGIVDGKMLTVPNPQSMTSSADRKLMSQQNLLLSAANSIQQPISVNVAPSSSSSSSHLFPPTRPPPTTSIKVISPTHSPSIDTGHNKNFFPAKMAPTTSGIHLLPPSTSTSSRVPMEKSEMPSVFDPLEFQKFADNEVNRLSETFESGTAAATGSSDNEIWQLSLPNLDVATGYGVSVNTDEGKGLDILDTNVRSKRCVCVVCVCACVCVCVPPCTYAL